MKLEAFQFIDQNKSEITKIRDAIFSFGELIIQEFSTCAMAILLGAFSLHGISPGPQIVKVRMDLIYIIIYTIFIAHCLSVVLGVGFASLMEKLTKLRAEVISPVIIVLALVGSYTTREYWQDILVATVFGILGYYMRKCDYNPIPLVLGVILGPLAELSFFTALGLSRNGIWVFFTRIPSLVIFLCILAVIFWPQIERLYKK